MKNLSIGMGFVLAAVLTTMGACGVTSDEPASGSTEQALSGYSGMISYYSDSTYTTEVGIRVFNCSGGSSTDGRRTQFAIGELDPCSQIGPSYSCYRTDCELSPDGSAWWCSQTCDTDYCMTC